MKHVLVTVVALMVTLSALMGHDDVHIDMTKSVPIKHIKIKETDSQGK